MPVSAYRYGGNFLAQANGQYDVQHNNAGMLELIVDGLVPGGKEKLILALKSFTLPGRQMGTADLPYINGSVKYNTKVQPRGNLQVVFRDFPQQGGRAVLQQLFDLTYDESTGLSLPSSLLKFPGYLVMFQTNGTVERSWLLEGLTIVKEPDIAVDFSGGGEVLEMQTEFTVDRVLPTASARQPVSA
jgi:hypothetical protein